MKDEKIERNLLEKASREFVQLGHQIREKQLLTSRAGRQTEMERILNVVGNLVTEERRPRLINKFLMPEF